LETNNIMINYNSLQNELINANTTINQLQNEIRILLKTLHKQKKESDDKLKKLNTFFQDLTNQ
jgi:hypothetical protein